MIPAGVNLVRVHLLAGGGTAGGYDGGNTSLTINGLTFTVAGGNSHSGWGGGVDAVPGYFGGSSDGGYPSTSSDGAGDGWVYSDPGCAANDYNPGWGMTGGGAGKNNDFGGGCGNGAPTGSGSSYSGAGGGYECVPKAIYGSPTYGQGGWGSVDSHGAVSGGGGGGAALFFVKITGATLYTNAIIVGAAGYTGIGTGNETGGYVRLEWGSAIT